MKKKKHIPQESYSGRTNLSSTCNKRAEESYPFAASKRSSAAIDISNYTTQKPTGSPFGLPLPLQV